MPDRSYIHESRESVRFGAMYRRSTSWRRDKYEKYYCCHTEFPIIGYILYIYSHYVNDVCICGTAFPCVKCVCQAELMDKKIASAKILSISRDNADHRFGRRGEKNASVKGNACVGGWLRNVQNPIHRMIRKRKCIWGKCMSWIMNTASEMNTTSALTGSRYGLRSTIFVFA